MRILLMLVATLLLSGCITVYECEGDHKETYNNISPTTQAADPSKDANKDVSKDKDKDSDNDTNTPLQEGKVDNHPTNQNQTQTQTQTQT